MSSIFITDNITTGITSITINGLIEEATLSYYKLEHIETHAIEEIKPIKN
jgi:hypothetical protein